MVAKFWGRFRWRILVRGRLVRKRCIRARAEIVLFQGMSRPLVTTAAWAAGLVILALAAGCHKDEDNKTVSGNLLPGATTVVATSTDTGTAPTSTGATSATTTTSPTTTSTGSSTTTSTPLPPPPPRTVAFTARLVHDHDSVVTLVVSSTTFVEHPDLGPCEEHAEGNLCRILYDTRMTMSATTAASSIVVKNTYDAFDSMPAHCPDVTVAIANGQAACQPQYIFHTGNIGVVGANNANGCQATCVTGSFSALPWAKSVNGIALTEAQAHENLLKLKPIFEQQCAQTGGQVAYGPEYAGGFQKTPGGPDYHSATQHGYCH